jgi:serine/threonine protein kinase
MPLRDGATFAGFVIVRRLGSGGMGEVYLAQHPRLPRLQALRILPPELSADGEFRARFQREADLIASLSHPNIVGVHDRGEAEGRLWVLMGYVEGIDAGQLLREHPQGLPRAEALRIIGDIAEALDHAHDHGLEHRNVKPGNILITDPGTPHSRILLADLGIARRIDDIGGLTAANLDYPAPEQLLDLPYQGRVDQYSLAATAYHLLSGSAPFAHASPVVVISRHLSAPPPKLGDSRPELADLDAALSRALAKDPGERFPRCHDLSDALRGEARSRPEIVSGPVPLAPPVPAPAPVMPQPTLPPMPHPTPTGPSGPYAQSWPSISQPWMPPPPRRRDRRWWVVGAAAVAMVAVVVLALVLTQGGSPATNTQPGSSGVSSSPSAPSSPAVGAEASAGDTGPAGIITADPTCKTWVGVGGTLFMNSPIEHWFSTHLGQQIPLLKVGTAWNPDERAVMEGTAKEVRLAATKTEPLIKATPHRVMREMYEQFVVYARAFAGAIGDQYVPRDSGLGAAEENLANELISICMDVTSGAATTRASLVPAAEAPAHPAAPQDPANLQRYVGSADIAACVQVSAVAHKYGDNPTVKDWAKNNQGLAASLWTPQQKAVSDAAAPLMTGVADDLLHAAQGGTNATMLDFATLSGQYQRAIVAALPSYGPSDGELYGAAEYLRRALMDSCDAIGA